MKSNKYKVKPMMGLSKMAKKHKMPNGKMMSDKEMNAMMEKKKKKAKRGRK